MYECLAAHVCTALYMPGAFRDQKKAMYSQELELETPESHHVGAGNTTLEKQSVYLTAEANLHLVLTTFREPRFGSQHPDQAAQKHL